MKELLKQLHAVTALEDLQKKTGKNINTMNLNYNSSIVPEIPKVDFFKYGNISLNKHSRFSYTPAHTHSFIEINYVLNGSCTQRLNGEKFQLEKEQLVILDQKVIQQIDYVDSEDIIINILLENESIQNRILPNLSPSSNLITDFFFQAANGQHEHGNYIILDTAGNPLANKMIESLLLAAFNRRNSEKELLINLLYCALMVEISHLPVISTNKKITTNDPLIQILKYINDNYTDVSLKSLGQTFGYNKNYLSNLLKDKTGSSFQELIDQKRLSEAKRLMSETDESLSTIAMKIGYKSVPSIFKLFQKETGQTPNFFRHNKTE
ncbi:AraC family transcriptional regulator [Candidatus Enterococcus murrayae]|uniref:Helix-turn-helix domain-containing protein n=1 Tax=Candidatus Enterococcus murrayae TaxID=2815321 RepID=A0ABS3HG29_9ENTE|nr:AraC family transcriptional regulator [Enterococcus sp. MJM16]MBO0451904.1 helix-turn-helix domain-containing protein [Enterococcus sp. MJM16]